MKSHLGVPGVGDTPQWLLRGHAVDGLDEHLEILDHIVDLFSYLLALLFFNTTILIGIYIRIL